jgi:hypothetical protein
VLALALAAFCGTAFAQDDSETNTKTYITNLIDVGGRVHVDGDIAVNAEAAANVDQDQATFGNSELDFFGDDTARVDGNALRGSSGNIGVNVSSGVGNAQSNDAAVTTLARGGAGEGESLNGGGHGHGHAGALSTAMVFSTQASMGNSSSAMGAYHEADLQGNALRGVTGNVGVNVAAGVGNAQSNGLAASVADASIAKSSSDSEQMSLMNQLFSGCSDNNALFGGNALRGASGNIGVNVAAGVGNLQHNGLAIAAAPGG